MSGGLATFSVVDSGGVEYIESGGLAQNLTVRSSGVFDVLSGGTASGTTISSGGTQSVAGTNSGAVLSGGLEIVGSGGVASGTSISSGTETVLSGGTASGSLILGGSQIVSSGGTAIGDVVRAGSQVVSSGGTLIGDTISGGVVVLEAGAVLGGGVDFASGGTLEILGTTMPTAPISGFSPGVSIDLASIAFDSGGSGQLASGNVLQLVESGQTYQLNFDPAQDFTDRQFVLTSDGSGGTDVTLVHVYFSTIVASGEVLNVSSALPIDTLDFVLSARRFVRRRRERLHGQQRRR
jgi:autotransporter passenger strand-loop-strand repeat protein